MLELARQYASYYVNAKTKHGVHSPFVFDLITKVFEDKEVYPDYLVVEKLRQGLLNNRLVTEVEDFGAGGEKQPVTERKISDIAARAAKPARWGKLLYRLCKYFKPQHMLEFGTSLGITSAYQALGARQGSGAFRFVSLEGSKNLVELAHINFKELGIDKDIHLVTGNFDKTLPSVLEDFERLDYIFIDGNHRKAPTLAYFDQLLAKAHNDTVFVFDDIHWSKEMSETWEELKAHPKVKVSIDLFYIGIIFLRKEQEEEHFVIRF